jgi:putative DNA primase/helicase
MPLWVNDRGRGTDFNDLHISEGLDAVRMCFEDPQAPEQPTDATQPQASTRRPQPASGASNTGSVDPGPPISGGRAVVEPGPAFRQVEPAQSSDVTDPILIYTGTPMKTAELFREHLPRDGRIVFWREEFYQWNGHRYSMREKTAVHQQLYRWMASCKTERIIDKKTGETEIIAFSPRTSNVEDVMHALRAVCFIEVQEPPTWLEQQSTDPPPGELVAFRNGLLHLSTRALLPSTPRLFITSTLDFDYDPDAPDPEAWHQFLAGLWPNDGESRDALGDMFGYMLTDDTSQQKMFMLIGPPRCGKGTILRILESMIGHHNRVSPSLAGIGTQFGLQPLIGKRVAMISDARLSGKADQQPIVENMLRISGEDSISIDRKNKEAWTGKLPTRFALASNELPAFSDASSALANRFILFKFATSFLGREDQGLTARLLRELPGIVLWALDGLERLRNRGHFHEPESSRQMAADLRDQTSPVSVFVREKCIISDAATCDRVDLFNVWKDWCTAQGREHPGTVVSLGRQLSAAFPGVGRSQPRRDGTRLSLYTGIRLRHAYETFDEDVSD